MNRENRLMKKGFTLVELIVVMAVMSILLVGVMSMTEPATRISKKTAVADAGYSVSNNIENYVQRTLDYADNLWIFDSATDDKAGNNMSADIPGMVVKFKNSYYKNVVMATKEGENGDLKFVHGTIYVMHLINSGTNAGQIEVTPYTFSNSSSDTMTPGATSQMVNPAYFTGRYADYNIRYALNPTELETVIESGAVKRNADTDAFYSLKSINDGDAVSNNFRNQALSIIVNRGSVASNEFEGPAYLTVANLQLSNISRRDSSTTVGPVRRKVQETAKEGDKEFYVQCDASNADPDPDKYPPALLMHDEDTLYTPTPASAFHNFTAEAGGAISTENDIYIIYSFADELSSTTP